MNKINTRKKYIFGIDRNKLVKSEDWLVYNSKEMDLVKIFTINFNSVNDTQRRAEIYYPPKYDFKLKTPAIILFAAKKYSMNRGSYVSWAEILAAKGFITITYEASEYKTDFKYLLDFIYKNNDYLFIKTDKIAVMAFCGALNRYFSIDSNEFKKYNLSYGIFFSGTLPSPEKYKYPYPLLIVNTGKDYNVCTQSFLQFKREANILGLKYKMIDFPNGIHRFDVYQYTKESIRTIKLMLKEIKYNLL